MDNTRAVFTGRQRLSRWCALVAAVLPAWVPIAQGQCQYEVTAIIQAPPCPFTGPPDTFPLGMNSHGDVVGYYWHCEGPTVSTFAFFRAGDTGEFITLPTPEWALSSRANDINDNRVIVGSHRLPSGIEWRAFVYDLEKQEYTILEPKHGVGTSHGNAINNNNVVAGARSIGEPGQSPNPFNAVIWDTNTGEVIDLGDMGIGPNSTARRISESGFSVLGTAGPLNTPIAFIHQPGKSPTVIGKDFAISSSTLLGLIADEHYAGTGAFIDTGLVRAFVFEHGGITDLIEPLPDFAHSATRDANSLGQVIVRSQTPGDRPGLWQHHKHIDLTDLVLPIEGVTLTIPESINNSGQILTRGTHQGRTVALLLEPLDRPLTDLNADCVTNVHDLVMLIFQWGPCATDDCPADFTGNGVVNVFDLLFLLGNWG